MYLNIYIHIYIYSVNAMLVCGKALSSPIIGTCLFKFFMDCFYSIHDFSSMAFLRLMWYEIGGFDTEELGFTACEFWLTNTEVVS